MIKTNNLLYEITLTNSFSPRIISIFSDSNARDRNSTATTCLRPGNYDIILLVDKMEVVGGSAGGKQNRKNITPEELKTAGVIYEVRAQLMFSRILNFLFVIVFSRKSVSLIKVTVILGFYNLF